jgi:periplasmic protein TonB
MSSAPALKIIEGGRIEDRAVPSLAVADSVRLYPVFDTGRRGAFLHIIAVSLILHGVIIAAALNWNLFDEERAIGGSNEAIVIEGVEIVLLNQMPNSPSPLAKATAIDAPDIAVEDIETRNSTAEPATESPPRGEALPMSKSVMELEAETTPKADQAERRSSAPVETATNDMAAEIVDRRVDEIQQDLRPPQQSARPVPLIETNSTDASPEERKSPRGSDVAPAAKADAAKVVGDTAPETASQLVDAAAIVESGRAVKAVYDTVAVAAIDIAGEPPLPPKKPSNVKTTKLPAEKPKPVSAPKASSESSRSDIAARGPTKSKAGAGGKASEARGTASLSAYQSRLVAHLRRYRNYPSAARSKLLQGTAIVSFTIDKKGRVVGSSLAKGTGHQILDREAIAMVRRASPFPAIPAGINKTRLTVRAPIRFDMR